MRGQNSAISSLPETFNFKHGSTSGSAGLDQHPCSNDIGPPLQGQLPECLLSSDDTSLRFMDSVSMEQQDVRTWSLGNTSGVTESGISSSEVKTDNGWLSPITLCPSAGSRWPELNPLFVQDANSNAMRPNINLNLSGDIGNSHLVMGNSGLCKSSGLEDQLALPASCSSSLPRSSGDAESSMLQSNGQRGPPFLPRRSSCKRKAPEENSDQPSSSTSHFYFGQADNGSWPGSSVQLSQGISISAPSDHANPSLELAGRMPTLNSMPDPTQAASIQTSYTHRNVRARTNTSTHGRCPTPLVSSEAAGRHFTSTSVPWLSQSISIDHSLNLMTGLMADNSSGQSHNMAGILVPPLPGNMQGLRLNVGSEGGPTAFSSPSDASAVSLHQRPRRTTRNMFDRPQFVPAELRQTNRSPSNALNNVPADVAAFSQHWSSSQANVSPSPSLGSRSNAQGQYSQRFSELVRRSMVAPAGADPVGPNSIQASPTPGSHASPGDIIFPSGVANQGLPRLHPRSLPVLERRGNRVPGFQPSSRTLSAASEGRNRLVVSEHIRNVLDLMRRGQNLQFEDVVLLDQSVFYGIADIHDRHRNMRLDVDNMSYEELLALEERIGNVCTGLDEDTIFKLLKRHNHTVTPGIQVEAEPCCICQEEYTDGEDLGSLECGHDFHTNCIKQWLVQKNSCPICKTTGLTK